MVLGREEQVEEEDGGEGEDDSVEKDLDGERARKRGLLDQYRVFVEPVVAVRQTQGGEEQDDDESSLPPADVAHFVLSTSLSSTQTGHAKVMVLETDSHRSSLKLTHPPPRSLFYVSNTS